MLGETMLEPTEEDFAQAQGRFRPGRLESTRPEAVMQGLAFLVPRVESSLRASRSDLGCGVVSVRVSQVEDCIVWSELSYESFTTASPIRWHDDRLERDFYFARTDYLAAIY